MPRFLAILNPAAGGGRCGRLAPAAFEQLRRQSVEIDVRETHSPGEATQITRTARAAGELNFLAVGGDGTAFEIVNGLFPAKPSEPRPRLGLLPLGTGNSFLRDFIPPVERPSATRLSIAAVRTVDVIRLAHAGGELYYINLLTLGFASDVAALANRRFKRWGELGYILSVMFCLARMDRRPFPVRADADAEFDRRPCLFLAFSNSKFTGGRMMIAPHADATDGLIEYVRWGPINRLGLLRTFPRLFDGTHIDHPLASRRQIRRVEFSLDAPVNATVDGESLRLECRSLEILPGALDVLL
jgi:diacylglycerol kinase (ATP)